MKNNKIVNFKKNQKKKVQELLAQAEFSDFEGRLERLKKAFSLETENLSLRVEILLMEIDDEHEAMDEIRKELDEYFEKYKNQIKTSGSDTEEAKQYFNIVKMLLTYYQDQARYSKVIDLAKQVLECDPYDRIGARYFLMNAYVLSYNFREAKKFFKYSEEHLEDERMLLSLIISHIMLEKTDTAKPYVERLVKLNRNVTVFFEYEERYVSNIDEIFMLTRQGFNLENVIWTFIELGSMLEKSSYLYSNMRKMILEACDKNGIVPGLYREDWLIAKLHNPIFRGISDKIQDILFDNNLRNLEDFEKVTKGDIRKIHGIGQATITRLEENGVKFKNAYKGRPR